MPNQQSFEIRHDVNYISKYKSHIAYMYHYRHENLKKKKKKSYDFCLAACIFCLFCRYTWQIQIHLGICNWFGFGPPFRVFSTTEIEVSSSRSRWKLQCFCYPLRKHMLQHFEHSCHRNIQCIQRSHGQCTRFGMFIYRSLRDVGWYIFPCIIHRLELRY